MAHITINWPDWIMKLAQRVLALTKGRVYLIKLDLTNSPTWSIIDLEDLKHEK